MVSLVRPPIPSDFCEGEVAAPRAAEPRLPRPWEIKGKEEGEEGGKGERRRGNTIFVSH